MLMLNKKKYCHCHCHCETCIEIVLRLTVFLDIHVFSEKKTKLL